MTHFTTSGARYLCIFFILILLLCGCGVDVDTHVESGTRGQILHLGNGTEPQDLDPHIVTGVPEHRIISALSEGLVGKRPVDLRIEPAVATSWTVSEDGRRYVFHIREEARWSNGDKLTAQDFVNSWRRALLPALANQYAYMLFYIENAEAFFNGNIKDFAEVGVKALDERTLQVRLTRPTPFFLQLLDHYSYFPVHISTIKQFGRIDERGTKWTRPGNFIGNGPFVLDEWTMNRIISVKKNPLYWDADQVKLRKINFYPIENVNTEEHMFRAKQLHITNSIPSEKIATYKSKGTNEYVSAPYLGSYYYCLNVTAPPLDDVRVRKALAMSINREDIVSKITKGGQLAAYNFTPPNINGYTAEAKVSYDIEKARRLLAEAGYPNGDGFPTLTLLYNTSEGHRKIAIAIQEMWKKALNIHIALENQDWKVYLDSQRTLNYQIARAAWIGDYLDPNTFLELFMSDNGNNRTGWSNARYDALLRAAASTQDQPSRFAIFQQAEALLMEELPLIPIYIYTRNFLLSPDVKGWHANILDHHPYQYLSLSSGADQ